MKSLEGKTVANIVGANLASWNGKYADEVVIRFTDGTSITVASPDGDPVYMRKNGE